MKPNSADHARLINGIETVLRNRFAMLEIKPGTKRAQHEECAFLSGAMAALNAIAPDADPSRLSSLCPPRWVFAPMRGKSVLEMETFAPEPSTDEVPA